MRRQEIWVVGGPILQYPFEPCLLSRMPSPGGGRCRPRLTGRAGGDWRSPRCHCRRPLRCVAVKTPTRRQLTGRSHGSGGAAKNGQHTHSLGADCPLLADDASTMGATSWGRSPGRAAGTRVTGAWTRHPLPRRQPDATAPRGSVCRSVASTWLLGALSSLRAGRLVGGEIGRLVCCSI